MTFDGNSLVYGKKTFPYVIYASQYTYTSSGVRALHLLCHALNNLGYEAYVMSGITHGGLQTPTAYVLRRGQLREAGREPIVVYPQSIEGNPLDAAVVARWLLHRPGIYAEDCRASFGADEMIFYHIKDFLYDGVKATRLCMPTTDPRIYNNLDNPHDSARKGYVLYMSRYLATGLPVADFLKDALVVSPKSPRPAEELAEIYRRSELFFAYETTAAGHEATLCGCPTVYLESPLIDGILGQDIGMKNGSAWGFREAEVAHAKATVGQAWTNYMNLVAEFDSDLRQFVEITQARAAESHARKIAAKE